MSATVDVNLFLEYFRAVSPKVSSLSISGTLFPVKEIFQEDIVRMLSYSKRVDSPDEEASIHPILLRYVMLPLREKEMPPEEGIDFELLEALLVHLIGRMSAGAILIFLPGLADIVNIIDRLKVTPSL